MNLHPTIIVKSIIILLTVSLAQVASGTLLRIETVTQPLYLHGSDTDPRISFQAVPYVTFGSDPEWRFSAIATPFVPPAGGSAKSQDVNLTSVYGITVDGTYQEGGKEVRVSINASKAVRPEGYPFTIEQVIDAVTTCVKIMYPPQPAEEGALSIAITRPGEKAAPSSVR